MAKVTIEVTQKHIDEGCIDACYCPVALAIRGRVDRKCFVAVDEDSMVIGKKTIPSPSDVADFVDSFDSELGVDPFSFEIEWPDDVPLITAN